MENRCWHKEHLEPGECPFIGERQQSLRDDRQQRFIRHCVGCSTFLQSLETIASGATEPELFPVLIESLYAHQERMRQLERQVAGRDRMIAFLNEVGRVLQTSVDRDEVIAMALTAVTAGKGFSLNRAILLLVDEAGENLIGHMAVGPREAEEAGRIWREVEELDLSLAEMAQHFFRQKMAAEREKFRPLLTLLATPLNRRDHLFVRTLEERTPRHILNLGAEKDIDPLQREALGVRELVLVPLSNQERRIGLLIADNCINCRPLTIDDLQSLEIFALPVSFAIERAALYQRLQQELDNLTAAHRQLKLQQDVIVRMERLALFGRLAADLAHSIRNPLMIIGGFSRSLLKETAADAPQHRYLDSIVREARRLEASLADVLTQTEALQPALDTWDVNRLLTQVVSGLKEDFALFDVYCRLDLAPDLPPVRLDLKVMTHCLRALLGRAMEGAPAGETVTIATQRREETLQILIGDHTCPPDADELAAIATAGTSSIGDKELGGLALCARLFAEQRVRLEFTPCAAGGTLYTITIPIMEDTHGTTAGG